ncbi:MAG TPA: hypothetical protein VHG08_28070 [Longimicrobium sp.]|nr:hypothetical protein [Longimicrobium sp.]
MFNLSEVKPLSDAISHPVISAYKAGGYGLAAASMGVILLIAGGILGPHSLIGYVIAALGAALIVTFLVFFYVHDVRRLRQVNRQITANRELIDTVQLMALEMTELAYNLQSLAFKHADVMAQLLTQVRSVVHGIQTIPFVGDMPGLRQIISVADHPVVLRADDLSKSIVQSTVAARKVIDDVRRALVESDPALLKQYLEQVRQLDAGAQRLLAGCTGEAASPRPAAVG